MVTSAPMRKWTRAEQRFLEKEREVGAPAWDAVLETRMQKLEALAELEPSASSGRELIVQAGAVTNWLEGNGFGRVWRGDPGGWDGVHDFLEYLHWEALMFEETYQRDTNPGRFRFHLTVRVFSEVLLALHLDRRNVADAFLLSGVREVHEKKDVWRYSTGAPAFQVRLYELWTGERSGLDWSKLPPLGPYEPLLEPSCVGDRYRESLAWACAEHIAQTRDSNKRTPPFTIGAFRYLPIELILWRRFRERAGLETDTDEHPLLESPVASLSPPARSQQPSRWRTALDRAIPHLRAYLRGG